MATTTNSTEPKLTIRSSPWRNIIIHNSRWSQETRTAEGRWMRSANRWWTIAAAVVDTATKAVVGMTIGVANLMVEVS